MNKALKILLTIIKWTLIILLAVSIFGLIANTGEFLSNIISVVIYGIIIFAIERILKKFK